MARYAYKEGKYPYYGIAAHIAINMIMAVAAGGTVAVAIAVGVQVLLCKAQSIFLYIVINKIERDIGMYLLVWVDELKGDTLIFKTIMCTVAMSFGGAKKWGFSASWKK